MIFYPGNSFSLCSKLTKFTVSHFKGWHAALVLLARRSRAHVALVQFLGGGALAGPCLVLAALVVELRRGDLDQVVGQQFTPSGQHGGDVRVLSLRVDGVLEHVDNILSLG